MPEAVMHDIRVLPAVFVLSVLTACLAGCSGGEAETSAEETTPESGTMHPIWENVPGYADADHRIAMTKDPSGQVGAGLQAMARRLREATPIYTVGKKEGAEDEMIGGIADVAASQDGFAYLLDEEFVEVRTYDPEGTLVGSFGRKGEGPSEFIAPDAIALIPERRLVVADRMAKVKVFAPTDSSFSHQRTISLSAGPQDVCVLESTFFVHYPTEGVGGGTVHAFGDAGQPLRTFGTLYRSGNPLIKRRMSVGHLACNEETQTVAVMPQYIPLLYGYAPDGHLKWRTKLTDYTPTKVESTMNDEGRAGARYSMEWTNDMILTLELLVGKYLLAQVHRRTPKGEEKRPDEGFHTYLVSAETGEGVYVTDALPKIYAATSRRLYGSGEGDFPQMRAYELPPAAEEAPAPARATATERP